MVVNLSNANANYLERTEVLANYYRDIRKYRLLEKEEEEELFRIYHEGSKKEREKARETIINSNQRFVVAVAKKYGGNDVILDLINEGNIGLIEALESYNVSEGVRFMTWAVWYIRRAINFFVIDNGKIVRRTNAHKTHHIVTQATNKFMQKEMRKPSLDELTEILREEYGVKIKDKSDIIDTQVSSIDASFGSEDDDAFLGETMEYNAHSASTNAYEGESEQDYMKELISSMMKSLDSREEKIIKLLFGIECDRPYEVQEVADKCNLTTERVRQLKHSILAKLKKKYTSMFERL